MSDANIDAATRPLEAPVLFLVFNRPRTTSRVFDAIRQARPRKLLIVGDGPRSDHPNDVAGCLAVRAIVERVDWGCEWDTNFSATNMGMLERFASGFRWAFERVDRAIVLEDDCLPHPSFFPYCADLLERYQHDPRVMWIGGTNPINEPRGDGSYFCSRINWMWGWATWKRAWQDFDPELAGLPAFLRSQAVKSLTPHGDMQRAFQAMFEQASARNWGNNWDIYATFHIWSHNGLVIHPNGNLISNIGFGDDAINTKFRNDPLAALPFRPLDQLTHPNELVPDAGYDRMVFDQFMQFAAHIGRFHRYQKIPGYQVVRRGYHWGKSAIAIAANWLTRTDLKARIRREMSH
jgi:hypothetical protein